MRFIISPTTTKTSSTLFHHHPHQHQLLNKPTTAKSFLSSFFFSLHNKTTTWAHSMDNISRRRRHPHPPPLPKVVVIMGPTGSGKSKLSVDLASKHFPSAEIINSDKIQLYKGLDKTTNKMTLPDRLGVTHHLLAHIDSARSLSPADFRSLASSYISDISSRRKLPFLVGGSNSLIYALLAKRFDPNTDVFSPGSALISSELQYNCCFLWVDVSLPVLNQYLLKRVDEMIDSGMVEELAEFYESGECDSVSRTGLGNAIGIPEFEGYFGYCMGRGRRSSGWEWEEGRRLYEAAVKAVKENTFELAKRQLGKIQRLREAGWDLHRIDATESFRAAMGLDNGGADDIWEKQVVGPSVKIVKRFLEE